jgi:CDP-diacylglycerol--glycerol-3-phosphate 3-phosphatidyltransferase
VNSPVTLPNVITLFRLTLIPLILALSYSERTHVISLAAGLFAVAVVTDWLDGYLARRLCAFSRLGTLLDPLVDKILVLGVFFVFMDRGLLPGWLFLLIMGREFAATTIRCSASSAGKAVGANWMGKTKFCLQVLVAALLYLSALMQAASRDFAAGEEVVFWSAVAMTVVSYLFLFRFIRFHAADLSE